LATTEITKETENIDVWILTIGNSAADEDEEGKSKFPKIMDREIARKLFND
jgi:hypothetical protein